MKKSGAQWIKGKSQKKKQATTFHLKAHEWKFLAELLASGYPLLDAVALLHVDQSSLQEKLEQGIDLATILIQEQKGRFYEHMTFFLEITSLADAIESSLQMLHFEKSIKQNLLKKAAYPCFILLFAYLMLWVFTTYIIPQMLQSFQMNTSFSILILFIQIIKGFCTAFGILSVLLLIGYLYLRYQPLQRVALLWKVHRHIYVLRDYVSYLFGGYLIELEKKGISTQQAMQYLKHIKKGSLFALCIMKITKQLEEGKDLLFIIEHATLLNDSFRLSFRVGSSTSNMANLLTGFMKQQEIVWDKTIQKVSIFIQCIAYGFVGIVVLIVYQIMLVPLSMLESM